MSYLGNIIGVRSSFVVSDDKSSGCKKWPEKLLQAQSPKEKFEEAFKSLKLKHSFNESKERQHKPKFFTKNISESVVFDNKTPKQTKEYSFLNEQARKKWKDDWDKRVKEAEEFAKKMASSRKELLQLERIKEKQDAEKAKTEQEKEKARAEKREREKAEEKARQLKRLEDSKKERDRLNEVAHAKPALQTDLYERMYNKYVTEVEMSELEKRKEMIAEKRSHPKAISRLEIEASKKRYEEYQKKAEEERKLRFAKAKEEESKFLDKVEKELKTGFIDELLKKQEEQRMLEKESQEAQKARLARGKHYSELVKESYQPTISEHKAKEMQTMIQKLKHPVRKKEITIIPSEKSSLINICTEKLNSTEGRDTKNPCKIVSFKKYVSNKVKKDSGEETRSSVTLKKNKSDFVKIDYWPEIKKKLPARPKAEQEMLKYEEALKNTDLTPRKKYELLSAHASLLSENARKKEIMLNVKGGLSFDPKMGEEISDLYLSAIKAKLSLMSIK